MSTDRKQYRYIFDVWLPQSIFAVRFYSLSYHLAFCFLVPLTLVYLQQFTGTTQQNHNKLLFRRLHHENVTKSMCVWILENFVCYRRIREKRYAYSISELNHIFTLWTTKQVHNFTHSL